MSVHLPQSLTTLTRALMKLPSIGERSATRMAHHLLSEGRGTAESISRAIEESLRKVVLCNKCHFFSEEQICRICEDTQRERDLICIVEKPLDVIAIERSQEYHGLYHVLHGLWSPLKGRSTESFDIDQLGRRIQEENITEIIFALGMTVEGDATCLYLAHVLGEHGAKVTRLAQGMPKGGELEFTDERTLSRAFSGRSVV